MKYFLLTLLFFCLPPSLFAAQTLDERLLPSGVPRQIQVDSTPLTGNNPVHIRDTADLDVANPSAGNVDITIKAGAVTDAKVAAGGITTRSKLPSALAYEDENNTWTLTNNVTGTWSINGAGTFTLMGSSSGTITIGRAAAAGTYNFNLPTSAGTSGQPLLSGGGGATPMSFGTLGLAHGGTNQSSWTAARCVRVNAGGTALESAAGDCGTGAGAIGQVDGTANEITSTNPTGPTVTLSLPSTLSLGGKTLLGGSPLKFEGATVNAFQTTIAIVDPTAARTVTLPNADTVTVQPTTCPVGERVSAINATTGAVTCEATTGTGDVTDVLGTANEISVTNSTGPQPQVGLASTLALGSKVLSGSSPLVFDGSTADANRTTLVITDPTASRTVTIPNADSATVVPSSAPANQFATGVSAGGVVSYAQPNFSNLGGTATNGQLPGTLSSKTLDNTNTYTAHDSLFTLQDGGDPTRQGRFVLDGITSGQTRLWIPPNADTTLLGNSVSNTYSGTQTQDFSASTTTLRLPLKAMPGSPAIGEAMINSADFYWRDNAGTPTTQRAIRATEMDVASGVAALDSNAAIIARLQEYTVATLPATPGNSRLVVVTDSTSTSTCTSGGGTTHVLCGFHSGLSQWQPLGGGTGGGAVGLNDSFNIDKKIRGANSLANAFFVGSDDKQNGLVFYTDEATGPVFTCIVAGVANDCDKAFKLNTGKAWALLRNDATELESLTEAGVHTYTGVGKPKKTLLLTADSLYMQGCTLVTDTALVSGGLVEPYVTCGDNDAHGFHRSLPMPDSWDGGTLTFELTLTNVNATPADNYEIDFSAACVPLGTAIATTISTTGEQPVNIDFDASGTCGGSACAQNAFVKKVSAAVTPNGTCAGGNLLRVQGQVDATNTTTAQVADVKLIAVKMEYTVNSRSD